MLCDEDAVRVHMDCFLMVDRNAFSWLPVEVDNPLHVSAMIMVLAFCSVK